MSYHQNLFVFDIETVIDCDSARNLLSLEGMDDKAVCAELTKYHLELTGGKNDFIRQPFHKVVAIAFLEAEITREPDGTESYTLKKLKAGGEIAHDEKELVEGVFKYLGKIKPRLISFNGRTFDLPVLKYRAMLHGVEASWFYKNGDKWNNYSSRYSLDWHCDLLEAFSDFGASAKIRMKEVCALLGLPGKIDVDGSKVQDLYNQGKLQEIRDYCELDVINTYLLYLHFMRHNGSLNLNNFEKCKLDLISHLDNDLLNKDHFKLYLDNWPEFQNFKKTA